jgi:hypothetical protein
MIERRMGERVSPTDLTVVWCPPGTKVGARRANKQPLIARVVDISQTGAQIIAGDDARVHQGVMCVVILHDVPCEVRVRWERPTNRQGVTAYGIEFVAPGLEFSDAITEVFRECYARDGLELRPPPVGRRYGM